MSIDREILFERLDQRLALRSRLPDRALEHERFDHDSLRWLTRLLVFHDPLEGSRTRGDRSLLDKVPRHKTLKGCPKGKGLPIGNLTSQFFANVYLDALDQFVKHRLKARWYLRYVDDFVLLHESKDQLRAWQDQIEAFLAERLRLRLNGTATRLAPVSSGIDFLGYVVHTHHRLVRRRVEGNLRVQLRRAEKNMVRRGKDGVLVLHSGLAEQERLMSVMSSYLAHFDRADARRLSDSLWRRHRWLGGLVGRSKNKLVRRDRPRRVPRGLRRQYAWFEHRAGGGVLFFQLGSYFELLGHQAREFGPLLGLRPVSPRPGFTQRAGFQQRYLKRYVARALESGLPVTIVRETSQPTAGNKVRRIVARLFPRGRAAMLERNET